MTSVSWFGLVFLSIVALVLVVYALLILLGGRTPPDPAHWDMPSQTGFDRTDERYWKLGLYMNPQDPGLLVPKRNPISGWTFNIGHPKGRFIAASFLLGLALLMILVAVMPLLLVLR
jgi:uncharacterized membrane protein